MNKVNFIVKCENGKKDSLKGVVCKVNILCHYRLDG